MIKIAPLSLALILLSSGEASADWLAKAFGGVSFAASHGFVDLEQTTDDPKILFGGGGGWASDSLALEFEAALTPGFFKSTGDLVRTGSVTTLMGHVTWSFGSPERTLRVFATGGAGVIRVHIEDVLAAFSARSTLIAGNVGGGATVRLGPRFRWYADARYFKSQFKQPDVAAFGEEFLAFTRVSTGALLVF